MFIFLFVTCYNHVMSQPQTGGRETFVDFLSHWTIFAKNVDTTKMNGQAIRSILHYFLVILDQYVASYSLYKYLRLFYLKGNIDHFAGRV